MKRILFSAFFFISWMVGFAQETEYLIESDIPYYDEQVRQTDPYLKERCVLDIYYPKNIKSFATLIWFHGGGLTSGNKEFPEALKEKGICIVSPNYRLYPNVHSPEYIRDAAAATAWVIKNTGCYGGDPSLVFVAGHSAGGYLTLMIGLDKKWLHVHDIDANRIAGLLPLSGQTITHFTVRKERGIPDTRPVIDDLAPLYHARDDAPPLWLITGDRELELPGRYEENAYLARMMKIAGHRETFLYELEGYGHMMTEPAFPLVLEMIRNITEQKQVLNNNRNIR